MQTDIDVVYDPTASAAVMDIYIPDGAAPSGGYPSVLVIHGGGWFGGDKADERQVQISELCANNGIVAFNINYSMHDVREHCKDDQYVLKAFRQCKRAVSWIRQHREQYQLNNNIATIGGSAGGNMALLLALTPGNTDFEDADAGDTSIQAVVNLYAPVSWPPALKILPHIHAQMPPVFSIHGTADTTVPVSEAHLLDKAMQNVGASHKLIIVEDAPHTFMLNSKWGDFSQDALRFFASHL